MSTNQFKTLGNEIKSISPNLGNVSDGEDVQLPSTAIPVLQTSNNSHNIGNIGNNGRGSVSAGGVTSLVMPTPSKEDDPAIHEKHRRHIESMEASVVTEPPNSPNSSTSISDGLELLSQIDIDPKQKELMRETFNILFYKLRILKKKIMK